MQDYICTLLPHGPWQLFWELHITTYMCPFTWGAVSVSQAHGAGAVLSALCLIVDRNNILTLCLTQIKHSGKFIHLSHMCYFHPTTVCLRCEACSGEIFLLLCLNRPPAALQSFCIWSSGALNFLNSTSIILLLQRLFFFMLTCLEFDLNTFGLSVQWLVVEQYLQLQGSTQSKCMHWTPHGIVV